ncbi:MAG: hypothetical protein LBU25_04575 [Treponema sp.]|nr:hypothetical protein [Treponema sp.]
MNIGAPSVRGHWGVENRVHWQLDVTFQDDQNRTMEQPGPRNVPRMKRAALGILSGYNRFTGTGV